MISFLLLNAELKGDDKSIPVYHDYGFMFNNLCSIYGACDIEVFFILSLAYTFNFDRYNYFYPFTFHSSNTQKKLFWTYGRQTSMFLTYYWQQICLLRKLNNAHNYQFPPLSSRLWLSYLGIAILELPTRNVNYNWGFCDIMIMCFDYWNYQTFLIYFHWLSKYLYHQEI